MVNDPPIVEAVNDGLGFVKRDTDSPSATAPRISISRRDKGLLAACLLAVVPFGSILLEQNPTTAAASHAQSTIPSAEPTVLALENAVAAAPNRTNRLQLSLAYIKANQPGRAVPMLQNLLTTEPNDVAAWNNLCVAHIMTLDLQMAVHECNRALELDPTFQLARNNLNWAESANHLEVEALAKMDQVPISRRDASFYLTQGIHLLHLGSYNEAIEAWRHTLSRDVHNASAANNIGTAYVLKNQPDMAIEWFERALRWEGSMQIAKNNIKWAQSQRGRAAKATP